MTIGIGTGNHGGNCAASSALGKTRRQLHRETNSRVPTRKQLHKYSHMSQQSPLRGGSHGHINTRRAAKIAFRSSSSHSAVSAAASALLKAVSANATKVANAAPSRATSHPFSPGTRHASGTIEPLEMEAPVLSFWGTDPVPLPSRFARIKRKLVSGHEAELQKTFCRLIAALQDEASHIEDLGAHLIPSISFSDIDDPSQTTRFAEDLKRYGVGVVRGVIPTSHTDDYVRETVEYVKTKDVKPPPVQDPTCFDFYWTPAQVRARAHPSVLHTQRFIMGLWETGSEDKVATKYPITYADRIRIHGLPGHEQSPPPKPDLDSEKKPQPAKSADDWLKAIQSSTIIAQVDNGSLERWEPDGYQRTGTYDHIFKGNLDAYDPWDCAGRVSTSTDLYNGYGACSIFRMFQGLLGLSTIEPGMIRLLPSPKLATAYFLLRPFFSPKKPCPESREGPEWEAFLHPDNWALDEEQSTIIHGAVPGHAQRVTELWHPHLYLRRSLITLPTLQAGDYIFWHPDLAYHITSDGTGLRSENGDFAPDDVRMLVYLPAAPLTQTNALYLARQRKQFLRGLPGPDFDCTGSGGGTEGPAEGRLGEKEIANLGGPAALQSMGLAPYEASSTPKSSEPGSIRRGAAAGSRDDVEMAEADTKSLRSTSSTSNGEADVVRLANIILFPDQCNMGFPHKEDAVGSNKHKPSERET